MARQGLLGVRSVEPMIAKVVTMAGLVLAMTSAACGGSESSTRSAPSVDHTAGGHGVGLAISSNPSWVAIVTLPGLGRLSYRCDSTGQRVASRLVTTGARATVEGDRGVHLHPSIMSAQPTKRTITQTTPFGAYRSLTWRVLTSNEGSTTVATIRLRFHVGFIQAQGQKLIDCALKSWVDSGQLIEHRGRWTDPPPWA